MRWDPFREAALFLTGVEESTRFTPDFEIEETDDGFFFKADLLGIKENEVDIAVTGNRLTISGHIYDPPAPMPLSRAPSRCRRGATATNTFAPRSTVGC